MSEAKGRSNDGVDWLRGRLRWEDRFDELRRDAGVPMPMPGPAAGGFATPPAPPPEPVRTTR